MKRRLIIGAVLVVALAGAVLFSLLYAPPQTGEAIARTRTLLRVWARRAQAAHETGTLHAVKGTDIRALGELLDAAGLGAPGAKAARDAWGRTIRIRQTLAGETVTAITLRSDGPDRTPGTTDDIVETVSFTPASPKSGTSPRP